MSGKKILAALSALSLAACATAPENITAQYVSPMQYQSYSCEQIGSELMRVNNRVSELTGTQRANQSNDAVMMGVGLVLFWPALFFLKGNGEVRGELGRLKGEYDALQQAGTAKNCFVAGPHNTIVLAPTTPAAAPPQTTPVAAPVETAVPSPTASTAPIAATATSPSPTQSTIPTLAANATAAPSQSISSSSNRAFRYYQCANGQVLRVLFDADHRTATVVRFGQPDVRLQSADAQTGFRYVRGTTAELIGDSTNVFWRVGNGEPVSCAQRSSAP